MIMINNTSKQRTHAQTTHAVTLLKFWHSKRKKLDLPGSKAAAGNSVLSITQIDNNRCYFCSEILC